MVLYNANYQINVNTSHNISLKGNQKAPLLETDKKI